MEDTVEVVVAGVVGVTVMVKEKDPLPSQPWLAGTPVATHVPLRVAVSETPFGSRSTRTNMVTVCAVDPRLLKPTETRVVISRCAVTCTMQGSPCSGCTLMIPGFGPRSDRLSGLGVAITLCACRAAPGNREKT